MLSLVCVYNKPEILSECLEKSLENQTLTNYEKIFINSIDYNFKSASEALNYGGNLANGEYIVFLHQDIIFENKDVLFKIEEYCKKYQFGVAGVAGVTENGDTFSKIYHGLDHVLAAENNNYDKPIPVVSLDECLLIVPSDVFKKIKFSNLGITWHLYGTDYVLKILDLNMSALLLPIEIWHKSSGDSLNLNYFDTIMRLSKLHKNKIEISTLFGKWPNNYLVLKLKVIYRKIRFALLRR